MHEGQKEQFSRLVEETGALRWSIQWRFLHPGPSAGSARL